MSFQFILLTVRCSFTSTVCFHRIHNARGVDLLLYMFKICKTHYLPCLINCSYFYNYTILSLVFQDLFNKKNTKFY